jgi:hypothetical protein
MEKYLQKGVVAFRRPLHPAPETVDALRENALALFCLGTLRESSSNDANLCLDNCDQKQQQLLHLHDIIRNAEKLLPGGETDIAFAVTQSSHLKVKARSGNSHDLQPPHNLGVVIHQGHRPAQHVSQHLLELCIVA